MKLLFFALALSGGLFATPIAPPTNEWISFDNFYGSSSSFDGPGTTMRDFITGSGYFGDKASPGQPLKFWGSTNGHHKPDSYGINFSPGTVDIDLLYEFAGQSNMNYLKACESTGYCVTLFNGPDAPPAKRRVTFISSWSLVFFSGGLDGMAFWQNGSGGGQKQFATFRGPESSPGYYVGIEDILSGDFDYNDMILSIKYADGGGGDPPHGGGEIPEPSTFALVGTVALLFLRRR